MIKTYNIFNIIILAKRRREMLEAEIILREELSKYRLWQQSLGMDIYKCIYIRMYIHVCINMQI